MKITADTNVLLRVIMADDAEQALAAVKAMEAASLVAISAHSLCELVWVLASRYAMPRSDIAGAIRALVETANVVVDRAAVDAGLNLLDAGGDFADGIIAFDGRWRGGETFVSFDRQAVRLLSAQGQAARLLA